MNQYSIDHFPLASTARWTAAARSQESARDDRIFDDPWALALAGPEGAEWLAKQGSMTAAMVIRTKYFDGFLLGSAKSGLRQVVVLAAGLDSRAYRLQWPEGMHLYELDQPAVLEYKAQIMDAAGAVPGCQRSAAAADLTSTWQAALLETGFDPQQPSVWLMEGFLFYLPCESTEQILNQVSELSAPGSRIGFDIVNSVTLTSPITKAWIEMQARSGAPWLGSLDDPEGFLASLGWQASLTQPGAADAHFNRWTLPVIPVKMAGMPHNWYVTAEKLADG